MVIAVGGNSLIKSGQAGTIAEQFENARETAAHVADIAAEGWRIALTHGNGPQVGFILRRTEVAGDVAPRLTLDMCGADSQGGIGYILQSSLRNALAARHVKRETVTVVTQVEVDAGDPAFENPTKPIGQFYDEVEAQRLERELGFRTAPDAGRGWRRVVPSPQPVSIVEREVITKLVADGVVTVCVGGGGIPVVRSEDGHLCGVEAVIDKDLATALLAASIDAEVLVVSTQVEQVAINFGTPDQQPLGELHAAEAEQHLKDGQFPPGSMGPKIAAALTFLRNGGSRVVITNPQNLKRALDGTAGTSIVA